MSFPHPSTSYFGSEIDPPRSIGRFGDLRKGLGSVRREA